MRPPKLTEHDQLENLKSCLGFADWEITNCAKSLYGLEREAFIESGFDEASNTPSNDAEKLKEALEHIADTSTTTSRNLSNRLVEVQLKLRQALEIIDSIQAASDSEKGSR